MILKDDDMNEFPKEQLSSFETPSTQFPLKLSESELFPLIDNDDIKSSEKPLQAYIFKLLHQRFDKQNKIDAGNYVKRGPGRNRKFQLMKTNQVKRLINKFFIDGLNKLNWNKYNNKRTDAWVTMYQRTLKKVTLFLLEKVSVRNKYKCNEAREYLVAYTETFAVFAMLFLEGAHTPNMLTRFLEFITIYYPTLKINRIADLLWMEGSINEELRNHIHSISKRRDKTSKKDFNNFAQNNLCMKAILKYSKEVFDEAGEKILKGKTKKSVQKVLYNALNIKM